MAPQLRNTPHKGHPGSEGSTWVLALKNRSNQPCDGDTQEDFTYTRPPCHSSPGSAPKGGGASRLHPLSLQLETLGLCPPFSQGSGLQLKKLFFLQKPCWSDTRSHLYYESRLPSLLSQAFRLSQAHRGLLVGRDRRMQGEEGCAPGRRRINLEGNEVSFKNVLLFKTNLFKIKSEMMATSGKAHNNSFFLNNSQSSARWLLKFARKSER